jgi:hypothetical protein
MALHSIQKQNPQYQLMTSIVKRPGVVDPRLRATVRRVPNKTNFANPRGNVCVEFPDVSGEEADKSC